MAKASTIQLSTWTGQTYFGVGSPASIVDGNLVIPATVYAGANSSVTYDLTESTFAVEFLSPPNADNGSVQASVGARLDGNNYAFIAWENGTIAGHYYSAGTGNWGAGVAYSPTAHKFLRLRETAGTLYFEYSADGNTWTILRQVQLPWSLTAVTMYIQAGNWNSAVNPGSATYGRVNSFDPPLPPLDWSSNTTIDFGVATVNGPSLQSEIDEVTTLAEKPKYELWYANWSGGQSLTAANLAVADNRGAINYVTWEAWDGTQGSTYSYANILAGNHNTYIDSVANTIKTFGKTVYLRPFHEMNGTWYPWCIGVNGNTAAQHIQAWNYLRTRFTNLGVSNVRWVWSPNVNFGGSVAISTIFPGNDNIDVIGVDGYNFGENLTENTVWRTPPELFDDTFEDLRALNITKPYWIGETGSGEVGGDKGVWVDLFFKWMTNQPELEAFIWFHLNKERDWRINSSTASATAFANGMAQITPNSEPVPQEPETISLEVVPWADITLVGRGTGSWSQSSGASVTLGGSGANRTFKAPPSMSNQTLVFAYGIHTATINIPRATHGMKTADGSVQPIRFSTLASTEPDPVTVEIGTSISIVADTTDAGTFITNIPVDGTDAGTFTTVLTPDPNDSGTFLLTGSSAPATPVRLKPTSATQAQMDTSVQTLWTNWKTNLRQDEAQGWYAVLANAQVDPVTGISENPYVAEGQGYGLMAAVQMADTDPEAKTIFDGITKFVLDHPSAIDPNLHAAEQDANMVSHNGANSATDGDMDIAMAHLMADKKWGSAGTYNYKQLAINRINAIKASIISPLTGLLELGDWSNDDTANGNPNWLNVSRPSDWMIGHFEAFYRATNDSTWNTVRDAHLAAVDRLQDVYAPATGLLPDFTLNPPANVQPAGANVLESAYDGAYYYNACRTPWRLGSASSQVSRDAALKMSTWAKTKCSGDPATLPSGYQLDGTTIGDYQDLSFIAPFAVGASCGTDQVWLNALWDYLAARSNNTNYYDGSIQLLCMIAISGTYVVNP